ncbi:MAG TPA: hypothetical protein VGK94_13160 [Candidatus Polarisedimenticolia bacterium]
MMRKRFAFLALPTLTLLAATTVLPAARPTRIAAVARDDKGKPHAADLIQQSRGGATFEIGYLDAAARRAAIRSALGRDLDLLPGKVDELHRGYVVFVLRVTNNSGEDLLFNPGHARLASDKQDVSMALDYSALYEGTHRLGPTAPTLEEMGSILFDREATVRPGGSVRKLLAFEAPREDRFRELTVRLLEINLGAESFDVVFPFRKFPVAEAGDRKQ